MTVDNIYNDKMNILTVQNNRQIVYNHSLKNNETYVVKDGFDNRYHISYNESEILNFIYNKQKLAIYYLLLSNSSISVPNKLSLVEKLDDFSTKSKYTPSLFSGGFFKDSDFLF